MNDDRLRIKPGALEDIRELRLEYALISEVLAEGFSQELLRVLERIETTPELYALIELGCRQVRLNRFPHVVTYLIDGDRVVVLAVLHGRRKSKTWKLRAT